MAVFPRETHRKSLNARDRFLPRWPVFATAFLILFIGFLPGVVRDAELTRSLQPSGNRADTPHVAKREPLRALAALERKEGGGSHWTGADGLILPQGVAQVLSYHRASVVLGMARSPARPSFWPAPLPRAPPSII